jgi:succinylglutamic semialdehyde dehydrogenase
MRMQTGRGDYIAGRFRRARRGAERFLSENPGDLDDPIGVFAASDAHVDDAVAAARTAQPAWARLPIPRRVTALRRIRGALARRREELALLLTRETGRPRWETRQEVATMLAKVDVTCGPALEEIAERHPAGVAGRLTFRPLGVVAVISPFNFPAHLPHGQLLPALATGCTVVVKPSELTPAVGELYAEIVDSAGLPPGVFNLVQGGPPIGEALAAHPDVDAVFFIGSFATGQRIRRVTLEQPGKLVALEMGGKNAALVLDDADVDDAAVEIARSAWATSGQRCTSTSQVVVSRRRHDALVDRLAFLARHLRVGYGLDDDVFMGPLISRRAMARFLAVLHRAEKARLAEPLVPALPLQLDRRGHYVSPALHLCRRRLPGSEYQREELFGPDLAVYPAADLEEALAIANDSDYGLCMSVYTRRRAVYQEVRLRARVGVVNWNRGTAGNSPLLPFGGLARSGNHRPAGLFMIRSCVTPVASLEEPSVRGGGPATSRMPGLPELPAGQRRAGSGGSGGGRSG